MKILLERLNFSAEKPQEGKGYTTFKVTSTSPSPTYHVFFQLCKEVNANLYYIDEDEIDECLDVFTAFDKKVKQEIECKGTNYLVCYFWLGKEREYTQENKLPKKGGTYMRTLLERTNFSTEKPLNSKQFHTFNIDRYVVVDTFNTFCLFCEELEVDLDDVELNDFNSSVDSFEEYYNNTKMKITIEGIGEVTCYFWVDGE